MPASPSASGAPVDRDHVAVRARHHHIESPSGELDSTTVLGRDRGAADVQVDVQVDDVGIVEDRRGIRGRRGVHRRLRVPFHGLRAGGRIHEVAFRGDGHVDCVVAGAGTRDPDRREDEAGRVGLGITTADFGLTGRVRVERDGRARNRHAANLAALQRDRDVDRRVRDVERNGLRLLFADPEGEGITGRRSAIGEVPERQCNLGRDGHDQLVWASLQVRERERAIWARDHHPLVIDARAHQRHRNTGRRERVLAVVVHVVVI